MLRPQMVRVRVPRPAEGGAGGAPEAALGAAREAALEAAFAEAAAELAAAKSGLDGIRDYPRLARSLDLYGGLRRRGVTNATLKLRELLAEPGVGLLSGDGGARGVRAFCNAELPGAFVAELIRHCRRTGRPLDWVASSFVGAASGGAGESGDAGESGSAGSGAAGAGAASGGAGESGSAGAAGAPLGDALGLLRAHPDRWLMVAERTSGDLTDPAEVEALAAAVRRRWPGGATLCTGDAGLGVGDDWNRAEEAHTRLQFGQALCALLALAPGGVALLKHFTFSTPASRGLITALALCFGEVELVKPLTSRPLNSEVFLICRDFRGLAAEDLAWLRAWHAGPGGGAPPPSGDPARRVAPALPGTEGALLAAAQALGRRQARFLAEAARLGALPPGARGEAVPPRARAKAERAWLRATADV